MSELTLEDFCKLIASDLDMLLSLHDTEIDEIRWRQLEKVGFPSNLSLKLETEWGEDARHLLRHAMGEWAREAKETLQEELATDFAAIYLNNAFQAPPLESVWLDEEGLMMQQPMFEVRECYARHQLKVADWRMRTDDHLVNELGFVSCLLADSEQNLGEAAQFLDEHLLRWVPDFGAKIAQRAETPFYAGLAALTVAYLDELRNMLAEILDEPRPSREEVEARLNPKPEPVEIPLNFVPGTAPSW